MSDVVCPECGKEVLDPENPCPRCGCSFRRIWLNRTAGVRRLRLTLSIFIFLMLVGFAVAALIDGLKMDVAIWKLFLIWLAITGTGILVTTICLLFRE